MKIFGKEISLARRSNSTPEPQILTKKPGFAVTRFVSNTSFLNLTENETNYFDQYILYNYKCIDFLSNKVASSKIRLWDLKEEKELDTESIFSDLDGFNPYMTWYEARKLRIIHQYLTGIAAWYIDREPQLNQKVEFYPLDPTQLKIKTDKSSLPSYYIYTDANGKIIELPLEDILYFRSANPRNWFEGQSHVKNIAFWSNAYSLGSQYNMNKLGNNANVEKLLYFEDISEEEREKVEEMLANKYQGVRNAGRTGVVGTRPEVVDVSSSQKDLDYVKGMEMLRSDILASYGIPEALFFPSATNSNTKEARTLFQADTLEPLLQQEIAVYNEQLIRKYQPSVFNKQTYIFKFDNVVERDEKIDAEIASTLFTSTIITRDQALERVGEEQIGGELGEAYYDNSLPLVEEPEDEEPEKEEEVKELKMKVHELFSRLDTIVEHYEEKEFRAKNIKLADEQEGIMHESASTLFQDQFGESVEYINKVEKPTVRGIFNMKEEIQDTKDIFRESYTQIITNSNDVGNVEIKEKLFKVGTKDYKSKAISGAAMAAIGKKLDRFSKEVSETTAKELRKLISNGIQEGFDKKTYISAIQSLFNGYLDGAKNMETLKKYGFYIDNVAVNANGGVVVSSSNRYNAMLESITKAQASGDITMEQMTENMKALKGLIDPKDPIGKQVSNLLTSVYSIPVEKGISRSRAMTIARTEATFARNLGFNDVYRDNPFVKGKKWNSLHDKDTRHAHGQADGQVVALDEPFKVGGEKLMFPGDDSMGASAENIINCRCRETAKVY